MTEEEPHGLDGRHQAECHTHSSCALGVDTPHEVGVCHVVETRDEHRDDGRHGHGENHAVDRRLGEELEIIALGFHRVAGLKNGTGPFCRSQETRGRCFSLSPFVFPKDPKGDNQESPKAFNLHAKLR